MRVYRVLVFPGGTEIGLEVQRALGQCKNVRLYSAGLAVSNHAPYVFARHFELPSIHDDAWIDSLNALIDEHGIDYVYPAYDDVLVSLSVNAQRIHARIIASPPATCRLTRSKSATYAHLRHVVPVPRQYASLDVVDRYPVFVKPDKGQGSQGTHLVHDEAQLRDVLAAAQDAIVLEYLPGDEFTVDCFTDRDAGLVFCQGRQRLRVRSGISMHSRPAHDDAFRRYAEAIGRELTFYGAWFFQLKRARSGEYKLLEIAPRVAGTMALHRVLGVNFPLLSIYEHERVPISIMTNDAAVEIDRALVNRYRHNISYNTVYVDLDDTLVIHDKVNTDLVRFLYQCINLGKRLVLLTKHGAELAVILQTHRLTGIFDQLIHLRMTEAKADHIGSTGAIFIDDSFSERKAVRDRLGIPTFDCSMLELLLDERV